MKSPFSRLKEAKLIYQKEDEQDLKNEKSRWSKVVIDIETSGFDYQKNIIVEIGMVHMEGFEITERTYSQKFNNQGFRFSSEVENLLGYKASTLKNEPYLITKWKEIINFIGNRHIVIHNSRFDIVFLQDFCRRNKLPLIKNPIICTMELVRIHLSYQKSGLSSVAEHFGIADIRPISPITKNPIHSALWDALLLAKCYKHIITSNRKLKSMTELKDEYISKYNFSSPYQVEDNTNN